MCGFCDINYRLFQLIASPIDATHNLLHLLEHTTIIVECIEVKKKVDYNNRKPFMHPIALAYLDLQFFFFFLFGFFFLVYCFLLVCIQDGLCLILVDTLQVTLYIYYCMSGRAIWGNIQLEGGSIGPTGGKDNT